MEARSLKRDPLLLLARAVGLKRLIPAEMKTALLKYLPYDRYMRYVWTREAPFPGIEEFSTFPPKVNVRLGIIKSYNFWHQYYMAACRELGVALGAAHRRGSHSRSTYNPA
jgi:hypothetical protein